MQPTRALLSLMFAASAAVLQAQQSEPLTYVALFSVSPGNTESFVTKGKEFVPTLEKLHSDGVITAYGIDVDILHQPGTSNVAFWLVTGNYAGLQKAQEAIDDFETRSPELMKSLSALSDLSKHADLIIRAVDGNWSNASSCKTPVNAMSMNFVKPGKGREYVAAFKDFQKPVLDQLVKDGTLCFYELDVEDVHSVPMGTSWTILAAPDMASMDKVDAAFEAANAKLSASDRAARSYMRGELTDPGKHRDSLSKSVVYKAK